MLSNFSDISRYFSSIFSLNVIFTLLSFNVLYSSLFNHIAISYGLSEFITNSSKCVNSLKLISQFIDGLIDNFFIWFNDSITPGSNVIVYGRFKSSIQGSFVYINSLILLSSVYILAFSSSFFIFVSVGKKFRNMISSWAQ